MRSLHRVASRRFVGVGQSVERCAKNEPEEEESMLRVTHTRQRFIDEISSPRPGSPVPWFIAVKLTGGLVTKRPSIMRRKYARVIKRPTLLRISWRFNCEPPLLSNVSTTATLLGTTVLECFWPIRSFAAALTLRIPSRAWRTLYSYCIILKLQIITRYYFLSIKLSLTHLTARRPPVTVM